MPSPRKFDFGELIVPSIMLLFGGLYYRNVMSLPRPEINALLVRPVFFLIVGLLALVLVGEVRRKSASPLMPLGKSYWIKFAVFAAATAAFLWGADFIGLPLGIVLYMAGVMYLLGERNPKSLIAWPLLSSAAVMGVFYYWLRLPISWGLLNFISGR